jgi:hypothetical protein
MPRLKTPCASDSRHAAPPNAAGQGGASQFCPLQGVFHHRQNKPGGNRFSGPALPDAIPFPFVRAMRRRVADRRSIKCSRCGRRDQREQTLAARRFSVRKNASGVRKRRRTDHRQAKVYDGDSAIRAAIAELSDPNWRAWS